MNAKELYQKLDKDFDLEHCKDDWNQMDFNEYISDNFKQRYMGLVLDNSEEIRKVCTAVFPSDKVINGILESGEKDVLLFTHHPMVWDINGVPSTFKDIDKALLAKMKENRISLYSLHTPLDRVGEYATNVSFGKAIGVEREKDFDNYFGFPAGIIGKTEVNTVDELAHKIEKVVGHEVKIWNYGDEKIKDHYVAIVTGGGNDLEALEELYELGVNTFVTGVTRPSKNYPPALKSHEYAKKKRINIIGATHYSTEKFACIAMLDYFKKQGLEAEFIPDKPDLNDLDYNMR